MKIAISIILLALLQAAFFAITYFHNPTDTFAAYYFAWVLSPAIVAAIAFAPRLHFVAATSNSIVSTLLIVYLFLQHGYFWPERPERSPNLAIGYVVMGIAMACVVAGFIHVIIERITRSTTRGRFALTLLAIRTGFVLSLICAAAAFPFCAMLGPVGNGSRSYLFAAMVAACLITFGTIISMTVGLTVDTKTPTSENREISTR